MSPDAKENRNVVVEDLASDSKNLSTDGKKKVEKNPFRFFFKPIIFKKKRF